MGKLSKAEVRAHAEAEALFRQDALSEDERDFVLENWHPGAENNVAAAGAFFTPMDLAADFALEPGCGRVIDLCGGIGGLAHWVQQRSKWRGEAELTCVEINPRFVEIGRKLLPEARWICADMLDRRGWWEGELEGAMFDWTIANPPFGKVRTSGDRRGCKSFEFTVIEIASQIADNGAFLLPQGSSSFRYSGRPCFERLTSGPGVEFEQRTGLFMDCGIGIDTSIYRDQWRGVAPLCEIVTMEFAEWRERRQARVLADKSEQLVLL
ncbi:methyltransferase [Labrys neptuniae]|uniref:methyltransferase n=1 Tax=Labrys neptuniae TaxID=376174 RepID=UPI0028910B4A|nr:methyltransferase [Labrys neptuniae]MDT3379577.1 methyltransferase [Labrys neptuniae]